MDELQKLKQQVAQLAQQNRQLQQELRTWQNLALCDPLTGVANRLGFEQQLQRLLASHQRYGWPVCLVLMDIDQLKQVNDVHGHPSGDEILRYVANRMLESVRASDHVARIGGDEFAILMPGILVEQARLAGDRIQSIIGQPNSLGIDCQVSFGAAQMADADTPESIFRAADRELYRSKHTDH